jgi:hypothetical protein
MGKARAWRVRLAIGAAFGTLCVPGLPGRAPAEEPAAPQAVPSAAAAPAPGGEPQPASQPGSKKGRIRRTREKETEGTQAPNRFEADTVIKSKYQLDGQPLEVDPD